MKTDSAVALKQMNTHTVTVRTRTAAHDAQTKCLSGPALRKAQEYLNLRHVVTPVVNKIRVLGVDRTVAKRSGYERLEACEAKKRIWKKKKQKHMGVGWGGSNDARPLQGVAAA